LVTRGRSSSPHQLFFDKKPKYINGLRTFGEMGVVTTKQKLQGKLADQGTACMFVGYPQSHACDVYKMFNLETKGIVTSRDVIWLKKTFGEWEKKVQFADNTDDLDDTSDEDKEEQGAGRDQPDAEKERNNCEATQVNPKVMKEMRRLQSWFNPSAFMIVNDSLNKQAGRELIMDQADWALSTVDDCLEPRTFDEAWNHPDEDQRVKWHEAIHKEFKDMTMQPWCLEED
jgi:hypothetical protein